MGIADGLALLLSSIAIGVTLRQEYRQRQLQKTIVALQNAPRATAVIHELVHLAEVIAYEKLDYVGTVDRHHERMTASVFELQGLATVFEPTEREFLEDYARRGNNFIAFARHQRDEKRTDIYDLERDAQNLRERADVWQNAAGIGET